MGEGRPDPSSESALEDSDDDLSVLDRGHKSAGRRNVPLEEYLATRTTRIKRLEQRSKDIKLTVKQRCKARASLYHLRKLLKKKIQQK